MLLTIAQEISILNLVRNFNTTVRYFVFPVLLEKFALVDCEIILILLHTEISTNLRLVICRLGVLSVFSVRVIVSIVERRL